MADVARLVIHFEGDTSDLDRAYAHAKRQKATFVRDASRGDDVKITADTSDFDKSIDSSSRSLGAFRKEGVTSSKDSDRLSSSLSRLGGSSGDASSGFHELAGSIRSFKTVTVAAAGIPAIIAGIGAIPAIATAATGATAQLALGLGQGLAGGAAIGGTAVYGAVGALKAYNAIITSTIESSREAYFALNEQAEEQLENRRNTILNTQASVRFNEQISRSTIGLTKLQAAVGNRVFPQFTREMQAWGPIMSRFRSGIADTAGAVASTAVAFTKWFRTAKDGRVLERTIGFINHSARTGAQALSNIGAAGILAFQKVIPYASRLQERIVALTRSMFNWVNSAKGANVIEGIVAQLNKRFNQLIAITSNVTQGLIGVFTALNNQGGPDRLMSGLVNLTEGFRRLMERGNGARQAIVNFMNRSQPVLNQLWRLVKTVVVQFGLLANNVVKAGQAGGKMGTLALAIANLRKAVAPLRRLFESTFIALGPILAKLIPEVAKLAETFLGSTGPLITFLQATRRILQVFNALPTPIKTMIANLVALKIIMGGLGFGSLISSLVTTRAHMVSLSLAAGGTVPKLSAVAKGMVGMQTATTASGGAAAATAGRFSRLGVAVKGAIAALSVGTIAATGGVVLALAAVAGAAYLVYKNWGRITQAAQPVVNVFRSIANTLRPLVQALGGALMGALGAAAKGFLQAVAPSMKFRGSTQGLAKVLTSLAKAVLPPVTRALRSLTNFINSHQGAFRMLGRIVGTVLTGGFRIWGFVLKTTWRIITGTVKVIAGLIRIVVRVTQAVRSATANWGKSLRNFAGSAMRIIRQFGSAFLKAWQNSIWGRAAKFLIDRAKGMLRTLNNWKNSAVKWVRSLVPSVVSFWRNQVWQPAANFLVDRARGMSNTLSNWLAGAKRWVANVASSLGPPWRRFWQGAADFVGKIKDGILNTMSNLVDGVIGFWNKLIGFINTVLDKVGLPPIGGGSSSSSGGSSGGSSSGGSSGGSSGSRTVGGQPIVGRARGGLVKGNQPYLVGEGHDPEAIVNLGRYTEESASALTKANDIWARRGWLDKARATRRRSRDEGEGLGATHHNLVDSVREKANAIASATGTSWNTYAGHGQPGGSTESYTADFWGPGGRGDPLSSSQGYKTASLALEKHNSSPPILYMIRQGEYWRGGNWKPWPQDPHRDHTHISWDSPGGASASGGMSIWDAVGNAAWNALVQPRVDSMVKSLSTGFILRQAAGAAINTTANSIKQWIIGQTDTAGSDALGGDAAQNRALGEELFKSSGVAGSFNSLDQLWTKESGWDRFAKNPSSGAYGIPQALPESKLPAAGQSSGGSKAGPQIGWGLDYIRGRYGSTDKAWQHSQSTGWYQRGGIIPGPRGKPVMIGAHAGERILPAEITRSFDRLAHSIQIWARENRSRPVPGDGRRSEAANRAQEDAARTLRRVEKRLAELDIRIGREVREGMNKNFERGLNTARSMDVSDARRLARKLAGGARIARAL